MLVSDTWPSFSIRPGSDCEGSLIDVARAVLEPTGRMVTSKIGPRIRAIEWPSTGWYTGAIGASNTGAADYSRFLTVTGCEARHSTVLVTRSVKRKLS